MRSLEKKISSLLTRMRDSENSILRTVAENILSYFESFCEGDERVKCLFFCLYAQAEEGTLHSFYLSIFK